MRLTDRPPRRSAHPGAARPRSASARCLALGGLAVAPPGLGGLAGRLLPRLRAPRRQRLADGRAVHLGVTLGESLPGRLPPLLGAPRRVSLSDRLAVYPGVPVGGGFPGRLPPHLGTLRGRGLQAGLAALFRASRRRRLQGGLPAPLRPFRGGGLPGRLAARLRAPCRQRLPDGLAALPPGLVRVRHQHLLAGPRPSRRLRPCPSSRRSRDEASRPAAAPPPRPARPR